METTENKSNAQENLNTVLGSIGTAGAIGLLGGNGLNLFGNNRPPMEPPATQRDLNYERQLTTKDMEIAQLKAQQYADAAVLAAERRLADKIEKIETTMTSTFAKQDVLNAHQTDSIMAIQGEVQHMKSVYSLYINAPTMAASEAVWSAMKPATAATAAASGN